MFLNGINHTAFGVMQGRLLPKYQGRYQAHPVGYWAEEFAVASRLGLNCIEFILDENDWQMNPLMCSEGLAEIKRVIATSGVDVISVCADYFMQSPLHTGGDAQFQRNFEVFKLLLAGAQSLGVTDIVIPCVDASSLLNPSDCDAFAEVLQELVPLAHKAEINLALETDLPPSAFAQLLAKVDSSRVTVNYDIGNSAALGYDFREELSAYGERITDIHIKDRHLNAGPVMLGTGDADIPGFFNALRSYDFKGPIIMQAFRDDEGVAVFKQQYQWLQQVLNDTEYSNHSGANSNA